MNARRKEHAFTLIELLIVISVMILLTTLALSGVVRALRTAAITQAGSDLRAIAAVAQDRALRLVPTDDQAYPGVLISQVDGRWAITHVEVKASGAAGVSVSNAALDADGAPLLKMLSPNLVLWLGDDPAGPTDKLAWFYEPGSGRVVISSGGGFSAPGAMVGYAPPALLNGTDKLVFGVPASYVVPVASAPTATNPGVSFRSRDQRTKLSVSVQPTGFVLTQEFN